VHAQWSRLSVVAATVVLVLIASAAPASAGELNGEMRFTRADTFYSLTDQNGTFTAQVTWPAAGLPVAWSFRLSPAHRAIAAGPMTCDAGNMDLPYHDHHLVPADYRWHSTVGSHFFNRPYTLYGACRFPVNVDGRAGTAVVRFRFAYHMYSTE